MFVILKPFEERRNHELHGPQIAERLRKVFYKEIKEAMVAVFGPPPVDGLGTAGGFKLMIEDRGGLGLDTLQDETDNIIRQGSREPGMIGLSTVFRSKTPQLYVDIDRTKVKSQGVE